MHGRTISTWQRSPEHQLQTRRYPTLLFQNPRQQEKESGLQLGKNDAGRMKGAGGGVDPKTTTARDTLLVMTIATMRKAFGKDGRGKNDEPAKRTFLERTPTKKEREKGQQRQQQPDRVLPS